ncbi:DUF1206 domain-containing protein [Naasia aerilata]|uniref:DUF1206 domain-containing protein n=1 Tax=Naasia aerilata TaxID=1162966 RepID=A0ABN6XR02_9MICO|nr:DUF1206 domain-containing protein [Naasia aerilata]BDZ46035.1 hypothetical protein GCM10025866_19440 [Naasia aerilata]
MTTRARTSDTPLPEEAERGLRLLARIGYGASAVIHLLLGYLAIRVAFHVGAESDQSGAIAEVGKVPGGPVLLWVMTIGLFALGAWLALEAVLGIGSGSRKRWMRTTESAAKALAYVLLGLTALTFARGSSSHAAASTQQASANLLALPGGQLLLALIGLIALAVGASMVVKGIRRGFWKDLVPIDEPQRRAVGVVGVVGYVAKGIAVGVVGVLFILAAVTLDPGRASGLDGALRALSELPLGTALLVAVGVGLMAFGVYTFARARYARL